MTTVTYTTCSDRLYFEATGHAIAEADDAFLGYGCDENEKAVCAALSILVLCAGGRFSEMESQGDFINSCITVQSGYALFDIEPREDCREKAEQIMESLVYGVSLLEENHPALVMTA